MFDRLRNAHVAILALAVVPLLLAGCGDDDAAPVTTRAATTTMPMVDDMDDDGHTFDWGAPGDAAAATSVVEITATDAFRFDPAVVNVKEGETVTFRVTNSGAIAHEFVVGNEAEQAEHEAEMEDAGAMMMEDEPNAIFLEPGETKDLTLTFTQSGALMFACHVTGHFAAGMIGDLGVQP